MKEATNRDSLAMIRITKRKKNGQREKMPPLTSHKQVVGRVAEMDVDQVLPDCSVAAENGHIHKVGAVGRAVEVGLHGDGRAILHDAGKIRKIVARAELTVQQGRQVDDVSGGIVGDDIGVGQAGFRKDKSIETRRRL